MDEIKYKYTVAIIEPREHKALRFVLNNFLNNLSDEWFIIIFHGNLNESFVKDIIDKDLAQFKERIELKNMGIDNFTINEYSLFLATNMWFYDNIPTETFLIFQTDTMIFQPHKDLINQFLEYDYVGAPWGHHVVENETVGNGGLSLRKKSKMLEIIRTTPYNGLPEDVFFCYQPHVHIHKPSFELAKQFSTEEIFSEKSFGCHKPWERRHSRYLFKPYPELLILYWLNL